MATFRREGELIGIGTSPAFGIGQRALLVRTPQGNVLWDCISLIDDVIVDIVNEWIVYDALYAYCQEMVRQGKSDGMFVGG